MVTEKTATELSPDLRDYELVIIVSPEMSDETLDATIEKVSRLITGRGGALTDTQKWGKRRLAYPIKHLLEGNYVLLKCKMKPASSRELEATLRITEEVVRHLLVKVGS